MNTVLRELAGKLPKIRITGIPKGDAPDDIKRAWIGLEIPCLYFDKEGISPITGVLSSKPVCSYPSFAVLQSHALGALAEKDTRAVKWWNDRGYPKRDGLFMFSAQSVKQIDDVPTFQKLLECISS